jgi:hypothetical protein
MVSIFLTTLLFLENYLEVYEISKSEKADFIAQALTTSNRFALEMDKVKIIPISVKKLYFLVSSFDF